MSISQSPKYKNYNLNIGPSQNDSVVEQQPMNQKFIGLIPGQGTMPILQVESPVGDLQEAVN